MMTQVEARCAHFGICGGCKSQHIPYDEQLAIKEGWIQDLFGSCMPILGCEEPWHWRNKMEFSFSQTLQGEKFLGLIMKGSRGKVMTLSECYIAQPWMIDVLQRTLSWWKSTELQAYYPPKNKGSLKYLTLREAINTGEKMVILHLSGAPEFAVAKEHLSSFVQAIGSHDSIVARWHHIAAKTPTTYSEEVLFGKDHIIESLQGLNGQTYFFKIRPPSFFQPNTRQAERLYHAALKPLQQQEVLFDLYCGTGTIGILASSLAEQVIGIEAVSEAAEDALINAQINQITNLRIISAQVEKAALDLPQPSTIIVDPPRAGLTPKALEFLLSFEAKKIIYISCNPQSQKNNIDQMVDYEITGVQPVDQFPHTLHVENIVFLESKG